MAALAGIKGAVKCSLPPYKSCETREEIRDAALEILSGVPGKREPARKKGIGVRIILGWRGVRGVASEFYTRKGGGGEEKRRGRKWSRAWSEAERKEWWWWGNIPRKGKRGLGVATSARAENDHMSQRSEDARNEEFRRGETKPGLV